MGAPSGSAAETLAYNTAQSASSASQARRDRREEDEDDYGGNGGGGGGNMHRSGSGGGLSGALAGLVGGGSHRRDLPPELDSMRDMIDAFVAGSKYWLAMQEALQQLVAAQAAVATAQAQVGELLSASKVADATSQSSGVLAPGAFGSAHAKAASARASAAKEMRLWVLEPLGAHVGAACVDASVDVKEYESGLDDLALQHAHVQKLAAKGARKAGETAQATAKLDQMRRRLEPLAQRVRSKLELLLEKQDSDAEKWVAKHASCERKLAGELTAAFTATLAFEQRAKGVPRPKVEEHVEPEEVEEAPPSKRGWLFGSSGGGGEEAKKSSKKASKKDKEKSRDAAAEDDAGGAVPPSRPGGSARSGAAAASRNGGDVALGRSSGSGMRRTASEPSGAVELLPTATKSMRGRLGIGAAPPADPPPPVTAASGRSSRHAAPVVDGDDDDDAAAEAAAKAARKAARRAEKERAAAAAAGGGGGSSSAVGGALSRDKGGAVKERDRERHAVQEDEEVTVSVFAKKKKAQLPEEPPPPPVAEKSRSKRAGW